MKTYTLRDMLRMSTDTKYVKYDDVKHLLEYETGVGTVKVGETIEASWNGDDWREGILRGIIKDSGGNVQFVLGSGCPLARPIPPKPRYRVATLLDKGREVARFSDNRFPRDYKCTLVGMTGPDYGYIVRPSDSPYLEQWKEAFVLDTPDDQ